MRGKNRLIKKKGALARAIVKLSHIYMKNTLKVVNSFTVLFTFCDFKSSIILKSNQNNKVQMSQI